MKLLDAARRLYAALNHATVLYSSGALIANHPDAGVWLNEAREALKQIHMHYPNLIEQYGRSAESLDTDTGLIGDSPHVRTRQPAQWRDVGPRRYTAAELARMRLLLGGERSRSYSLVNGGVETEESVVRNFAQDQVTEALLLTYVVAGVGPDELEAFLAEAME